MNENKSCYNCKNIEICFIHTNIYDTIVRGYNILKFDNDQFEKIYKIIATNCLEYSFSKIRND